MLIHRLPGTARCRAATWHGMAVTVDGLDPSSSYGSLGNLARLTTVRILSSHSKFRFAKYQRVLVTSPQRNYQRESRLSSTPSEAFPRRVYVSWAGRVPNYCW